MTGLTDRKGLVIILLMILETVGLDEFLEVGRPYAAI